MDHIYTFHAVEINTDWAVFYVSAVLLFWKASGRLQGVFPHKCYRIPCFIMLVYSNGAKVYKMNIIMIMHNTGYGGRTNPIFLKPKPLKFNDLVHFSHSTSYELNLRHPCIRTTAERFLPLCVNWSCETGWVMHRSNVPESLCLKSGWKIWFL